MTLLKQFLILFLFFSLSNCASLKKNQSNNKFLSQEDAVLRSAIVSNTEYNLSIYLDKEKSDFKGTTKISFLAKKTDQDLKIDFVDGTVTMLMVNGNYTKADYDNISITIPANTLKLGKNTITITHSHPYSSEGRGLNKTVDKKDGRIYLYSQFEVFDANRVFPCFDQPDLKATYTMKVTAPKSWEVISAERETSIKKINDNFRQWTFPTSQKFSTYIFSLHAGDYVSWKSKYKKIPLRLFARKSLAKYVKPNEWFGPTKIGLKFFPKYFKTKFPYKKYDQLIVPELSFGAMENVGAVTFNENFVSRGVKTQSQIRGLDNTIYHEMAHMWFGNLVTMKWWNDLWLNESFATYAANITLAKATRHKEKTWLSFNRTKEWAYWEDRLVTTHPILTSTENTDRAFSNFDGITYGKGASSLKQLVYYIGEENFKNGLELYFKRHSLKNTELKDFMSALSDASKMNLNNWQKKWLETTGINSIVVDFDCDKNNKISKFQLLQSANKNHPTIRPHKLLLAFMKNTGRKVKTYKKLVANIDGKSNALETAIGLTCPEVVYPNFDDHGYINTQLDKKSVKYLEKNIHLVENPLVAKMLWGDLWRMVRDGKYNVASYGELILSKLETLNNPEVFKTVFKIRQVLYYLPKSTPQEKEQYNIFLVKAENQLWKKFKNKKNSKDLRKQLFYKIVESFKTNAAHTRLLKLLDPKLVKTKFKLKVDQDMRWMLIKNLARHGHKKTTDLVTIEKIKDTSNKGIKAAHVALASTPNWKIKKQWISEFKKPKSEYSLNILSSVARNLFPSDQNVFRKKHSKSFFKDLKQIIKDKDMLYASSYTSLSPRFCDDKDPDLIPSYLNDNSGIAPSISRRLKITRQESERCRTIRQFARNQK